MILSDREKSFSVKQSLLGGLRKDCMWVSVYRACFMLYNLNFLYVCWPWIHFGLPVWQTEVASDSVYGIISGVAQREKKTVLTLGQGGPLWWHKSHHINYETIHIIPCLFNSTPPLFDPRKFWFLQSLAYSQLSDPSFWPWPRTSHDQFMASLPVRYINSGCRTTRIDDLTCVWWFTNLAECVNHQQNI